MKTSTRKLVTAALLAGTFCASAATSPRDHAARVAPYIDPQTLVIAYLDLAAFDFDAAAAFGAAITGTPKETVRGLLAPPEAWVSSLVKAGGQEIYWILSLDDIGFREGLGAFVLAVVRPDGDAELVGRLLEYGASEKPETPNRGPWQELFGTGEVRLLRPGLVFCGHLPSCERITSGPPSPRAGLVDAFTAGGDAPVQVVVIPTDTHRRVVEEMLPRLPQAIGSLPGTVLARGLQYGNLSFGLPPAIFARMTVESQDGESAQAFRNLVAAGLDTLVQQKDLVRQIPQVASLAELLEPTVEGSRMTLSLDREEIEGAAGRIAARMTAIAKDESSEALCQDRLRQIGIGLTMYSIDHKTLPESLDALGAYGVKGDTAECPALGPYVYYGAGVDLEALRKREPRAILAADAAPHATGGYNVLFADGYVDFIETDRLGAYKTAADVSPGE